MRRLRFILAGGLILGLFLAIYPAGHPRVLAQKDIYQLREAPIPEAGQRVLIFSPHPDDETIALGGYIAEACRNRADVRVALITDGNKHHHGQIRYTEFRKAMSILGLDSTRLVFMNFPDTSLRYTSPPVLFKAFQEQIAAFNPDTIIYPHTRDFHPDHYTAGRILNKVLAASSHHRQSYQYLVHYEFFYPKPQKYAPNLYLLPPVTLSDAGGEWRRSMLAPDIEDLKAKALFTYQSQLKDPVLRTLLRSSVRKNELLDFADAEFEPNMQTASFSLN